MTDITSAKKKIQIEEVDYRSAVSEATFTKIGGSVNWIIENSTFAVGTIVSSMLTLAQYQGELDTKWVLCNGASCVGSDYETLTGNSTVPDLVTGQRFLRQADVDGSIGTTQSSQNLSHNHSVGVTLDHAIGGEASGATGYRYYTNEESTSTSSAGVNVSESNNGGSEARPNNMQVNYFIKINN